MDCDRVEEVGHSSQAFWRKGTRMRAKSLQLCLTRCDPLDRSPPGSSVPEDSPGKNTGVDCHAPPEDFPEPEIKPESLVSPTLAGRLLPLVLPGEPREEVTDLELIQLGDNANRR